MSQASLYELPGSALQREGTIEVRGKQVHVLDRKALEHAARQAEARTGATTRAS